MKQNTPADIKELTSLRFFAAFTVVMFHMFFNEDQKSGMWNKLIADGHLGVDLFFTLSGFILTHVYLSEYTTQRFRFGAFLWKRFARIYPLHIFMVLIFLITYWVADLAGFTGARTGQSWSDLPWHLLLLHAWGSTDGHSWNFPSWSVSAEAFAYLIFPWVMSILLRFRPIVSLLASSGFFILLSLATASQGLTLTKMMYNFGIVRILGEFCIGVALYRVFITTNFAHGLIRPAITVILCSMAAASAAQVDERVIVFLLAMLILAVACLSRQTRGGILRHPLLVYLGEISYATYMVHIIVIIIADSLISKLALSRWMVYIFSLCLIYTSSAILHHLVELPGRRFFRSILPRVRNPSHLDAGTR
jgi:peptidoglycan/LPS O-acetylase OafA/YrhL